jgi:hypothetical protein
LKADELNKEDLYRINTNKFENAVLGSNRSSFINVKTGDMDELARRVAKCDRDEEFSDIASIPSISFSGEEQPMRWSKFQVITNTSRNNNPQVNNSISSGSTSELLKQSPYCPLSDSMNTTLNTIGSGYKYNTTTTVDEKRPTILNIPYFSSFSDKNSTYEPSASAHVIGPTHTIHKLNIVRNPPVSVEPLIQPSRSELDSFINKNGLNGSSFTQVSPDHETASLAEEFDMTCDYEKTSE